MMGMATQASTVLDDIDQAQLFEPVGTHLR